MSTGPLASCTASVATPCVRGNGLARDGACSVGWRMFAYRAKAFASQFAHTGRCA